MYNINPIVIEIKPKFQLPKKFILGANGKYIAMIPAEITDNSRNFELMYIFIIHK